MAAVVGLSWGSHGAPTGLPLESQSVYVPDLRPYDMFDEKPGFVTTNRHSGDSAQDIIDSVTNRVHRDVRIERREVLHPQVPKFIGFVYTGGDARFFSAQTTPRRGIFGVHTPWAVLRVPTERIAATLRGFGGAGL